MVYFGYVLQDFATQLSVLSQRAASSPDPLPLDSVVFSNKNAPAFTLGSDAKIRGGRGVILPPVNLVCLPRVGFNLYENLEVKVNV